MQTKSKTSKTYEKTCGNKLNFERKKMKDTEIIGFWEFFISNPIVYMMNEVKILDIIQLEYLSPVANTAELFFIIVKIFLFADIF